MCGKFALGSLDWNMIGKLFLDEPAPVEWEQKDEVFPGTMIPIILKNGAVLMKWGYLPSWAKESNKKVINSRSETISEKPYFRESIRERRCLIPANGFYEWKTDDSGKSPYFVFLKNIPMFFMAGIWDTCNDVNGVSIMTIPAGEKMSEIHHRMPVILPIKAAHEWITLDYPDVLETIRPVHEDLVSIKSLESSVKPPNLLDL